MPTFEFGNYAKRRLNMNIVAGVGDQVRNSHGMLESSVFGRSFRLRIMKGAYPTTWDDLTSTTSRSADTLIEYSNVGDAISSMSTISDALGTNFITINTSIVPATQSGTASWFWAYTLYGSNVMGFRWLGTSITVVGGGGDLEIETLNIVSGTNYRVTNFRIDFQSVYTY